MKAAGQKKFCTWLATQDNQTQEIVYLYHIRWTVDYGTPLTDGSPQAGRTMITGQGPGQGDTVPCLDAKPVTEEDFPFKLAFTAAAKPAPAGQPGFTIGGGRQARRPQQPQPAAQPPAPTPQQPQTLEQPPVPSQPDQPADSN